MEKTQELKVGDPVIVKPGVICPDNPNLPLGGFQGRVTEIDPEYGTVAINWDSITLRSVPQDYIHESEMEGLSWETMVLGLNDIELAASPDSAIDTTLAFKQISDRDAWDYHADTNPGIQRVLSGIAPEDITALLAAWEAYLEESLIFPFDARVAEVQYEGPVPVGERVLVSAIEVADPDYGILVHARHKHNQYIVPLCDLEASDLDSPNYQPVKDYVVWFANR